MRFETLLEQIGVDRRSKTGRKIIDELDDEIVSVVNTSKQINISGNGGAGRYASVYYVSPTGDDSTGAANSQETPFATINAAGDAARAEYVESGITPLVYVRFGTYEESQIIRNRVDMYFEDQTLVWHPDTAVLADNISEASAGFDTTDSSQNWLNIYGHGTFMCVVTHPGQSRSSVNLENVGRAYIEAKDVGVIQTSGQNNPGSQDISFNNCLIRFNLAGENINNTKWTFNNCELWTPVLLTDFAENDTIERTFNDCDFRLLADYSYPATPTEVSPLYDVFDHYNTQLSGQDTYIRYFQQPVYLADQLADQPNNAAAVAAAVPASFRPIFVACVEGRIQGSTDLRNLIFNNCRFFVERERMFGIFVLQDIANSRKQLIFNGCQVIDATTTKDTSAIVFAKLAGIVASDEIASNIIRGIDHNCTNARANKTGYTNMDGSLNSLEQGAP